MVGSLSTSAVRKPQWVYRQSVQLPTATTVTIARISIFFFFFPLQSITLCPYHHDYSRHLLIRYQLVACRLQALITTTVWIYLVSVATMHNEDEYANTSVPSESSPIVPAPDCPRSSPARIPRNTIEPSHYVDGTSIQSCATFYNRLYV